MRGPSRDGVDVQQSTYFISNLHCPSCISTIETILTASPFSLSPDDLSILVLTGLATITWPPQRSVSEVEVLRHLSDAGFEVGQEGSELLPTHQSESKSWFTTRRARQRRERTTQEAELKRAEAHRATCKACQGEATVKGKEKECVVSMGEGVVTTEIAIDGMTCSSSVGAVERILLGHPKVRRADVTLLPGRAVVTHGQFPEGELVDSLEDAGYDARVTSTRQLDVSPRNIWMETKLVIEGMTCASCVGSLQNVLKAMPGVRSYTVTLLPGLAVVVHDSSVFSVDRIVLDIEEAGFEAHPISSAPHNDVDRDRATTREVKVRIDGFFCDKCPAAVEALLSDLVSKGALESYTPPTLRDPHTTLHYWPDPSRKHTLREVRSLVTAIGPFTFTPLRSSDALTTLARNAHARESRAMALRLSITFLFAVPTFIIAIVAMSLLPASHSLRMYFDTQVWGSASRGTVVLFALATPVQLGVGSFFYRRAWKSLRGVWIRPGWRDRLLRWGSMDTLVALGTTVGWIASVAFMALDVEVGRQDTPGEMGYFDSSVFLILFILAGRWLEGISRQRTGDAIEALGRMKASTGLLWSQSAEVDSVTDAVEADGKASIASSAEVVEASVPSTKLIEVDFLECGDIILIPSGESVPLDAVVIPASSSSNFDESGLTGEALPVHKTPGDTVFAGTTNLGPSAVLARVQNGPGDTLMDGIVSAVRDAMSRKASIERIADRVTGYFVPGIVSIAVVTFIVWLARGYAGNLPSDWLKGEVGRKGGWALFAVQFTVAVLVVACPCGIGLAAPTAQMVGTGMAARLGIVPYGGGEAFQNATKIDCVVFDKTGTLTRGEFTVSHHHLCDSTRPVWQIAQAVELTSTHPISLGVRDFCQARAESDPVTARVECLKSEEVPGRGLVATVIVDATYVHVLIGNESLMRDYDVGKSGLDEVQTMVTDWSDAGCSIVMIAWREADSNKPHRLSAVIGVQDTPRPEASQVVAELKKLGIVSYMCTGDARESAVSMAAKVGIDASHVFAGVLPVEKQACIERLQHGDASDAIDALRRPSSSRFWRRRHDPSRAKVLFLGDGINDVVALTQADVGVSMGTGAAVALTSSDFCLLSSNLSSLLTLLALAKSTYRKILTNFAWACCFNTVLIPIAAGAFYDLGRTRLPPVWASLAMALSSVSVVLNSLSLRWTFRVPKVGRPSR